MVRGSGGRLSEYTPEQAAEVAVGPPGSRPKARAGDRPPQSARHHGPRAEADDKWKWYRGRTIAFPSWEGFIF